MNLKLQTASSIIASLKQADIIAIENDEIDVLVNNIVMTVTYWIAYSNLREKSQQEQVLLHKGVFQVLSLISPFLSSGKKEYRDFCNRFYMESLKSSV